MGSHFGVGAPPILVYFSGDWDVHREYGVLTHGHLGLVMPSFGVGWGGVGRGAVGLGWGWGGVGLVAGQTKEPLYIENPAGQVSPTMAACWRVLKMSVESGVFV